MSEKIRILQITGTLNIGGLESVAMNIFRFLDRDKYDVRFVVYGDAVGRHEAEVIAGGGKVYHIDYPHAGIRKYREAIRKILRETGLYQVVHSHNLFPTGLVMQVAKEEGVPVRIAHAHTNRDDRGISLPRRLYQGWMRSLMHRFATDFFACSERAASYLFGEKYLPTTYIMQNGVDLSRFVTTPEETAALRRSFDFENKRVIGFTAGFNDVKNHAFLVDRFAEIVWDHPEFRLIFFGDGELRKPTEEKVKSLGLSDAVVFAGNRSDVPALLSMLDVYVHPSLYEGTSVALMEAQAAGVPFVVSKTAYSKESAVTGYGEVLDLSAPAEEWDAAILRAAGMPKLSDAKERIARNGYDVAGIVCKVEEKFYRKGEEKYE